MKHSSALSQRTPMGSSFAPLSMNDHPECETELIHLYDGFWSDVFWGVFYCPNCDQIICCVEGGVHWWNFTSAEPNPENIQRGRALAAMQTEAQHVISI